MATRIEIDYDRQFINSVVQEIIARAAATINVLEQLGPTYQSLPGMASCTSKDSWTCGGARAGGNPAVVVCCWRF